jgi:hypothetical protein
MSFEHIPPEHWLGTPEEYEARVKAAAAKLRTMAETAEGLIYQNLGTWLSRVVLEERHAGEVVIESPGDTSFYARRTCRAQPLFNNSTESPRVNNLPCEKVSLEAGGLASPVGTS